MNCKKLIFTPMNKSENPVYFNLSVKMPITFFKTFWRFYIILIKNHNKFDRKEKLYQNKAVVSNDRNETNQTTTNGGFKEYVYN